MQSASFGVKNNLKILCNKKADTASQTLFLPATDEFKEFFF
jgi:hypothetical protein